MEEFAVNIKGLLAQIINFGIILFLLSKFAYKPILAMMENRSRTIEEGLKNSEEAKTRLEKAAQESEKIREKAYTEAKQITSETKEAAAKEAAAIVTKAETQASNILKAAENEATTMKTKALSGAKTEIAHLVMLAVEKIVGDKLNLETKEELTVSAVKEL
ncbi:MAG: F0F1 ATP synthase subunit B [Patescibacteria group bacterium]|jgi:F-type H+-transporting ATPase subunit b